MKTLFTGVHLDPEDYHAKLKEDNTVVIDVRNAYESDIGRFGGQQSIGGAQLLLPDMRKSTDFPDWIEKEETKEMLSGKNVLMYCTGGVRCERASALLKSKYGDDIKEVYQLQGGIEKYLQSFPDGGFWQGKNFVFDKREAIGVGCRDGVGGIVQCSSNSNNKNNKNKNKGKQDSDDDGDDDENNNASSDQQMKRKKTKLENSETTVTNSGDDDVTTAAHTAIAATVLGKCCGCTVSWDRYVGKKKCATCGVPVLLCTACSSIKGMLDKQQLRQKKNKKLSGDDDDDEEEDEVMNKQCDENNINNNSSITMELLDSAITAALIKAAVNLPFNACNNNKNEKKKKKTKRQSKQQLTTERKQQAADMLLQRLKLLRCPLCVNENCTVPVEMLNFTANGTKAAAANSWDEGGCDATISTTATTTAAAGSRTTHSIGSSNKKIIFGDDGIDDAKYDSTVNSGKDAVTAASSSSNSSDKSAAAAATVVVVGKAASTVCKWGGGYSNREKKVKNRQQQEDVVDSSTSSSGGKKIARPCKWGSRCNRRSECWFQHDDGNDNVAVN